MPERSWSVGLGDYILIRDEKAANTSGGTFTLGVWRTRDLTTEVVDTGGHASLAANQITLAAGTYRCNITCPAYQVARHKAKLRNVTDSTDVLIGSSAFSQAAGNAWQTDSFIVGRFTLTASKVLEVQHQGQLTLASFGFGVESNFGVVEVYTVAEFWREG